MPDSDRYATVTGQGGGAGPSAGVTPGTNGRSSALPVGSIAYGPGGGMAGAAVGSGGSPTNERLRFLRSAALQQVNQPGWPVIVLELTDELIRLRTLTESLNHLAAERGKALQACTCATRQGAAGGEFAKRLIRTVKTVVPAASAALEHVRDRARQAWRQQ